MKVVRFNVSKPKKYTDNQGNEKTQWNNVGVITEFHKDNGQVSRIIEIPAIGLDANIFPIVPKEHRNDNQVNPQVDNNDGIDYPDDDINPEDIPF